eukprot:25567-Eustigmatos_ZCMA.PRE.1
MSSAVAVRFMRYMCHVSAWSGGVTGSVEKVSTHDPFCQKQSGPINLYAASMGRAQMDKTKKTAKSGVGLQA